MRALTLATERSSTLARNLPTPTPNPSPTEVGCFRLRSLLHWPNSGTPEFGWGGEFAEIRASSATMKPKAAGVPPSSGTISCRAPPARPPSGRWLSMAARPKGKAFAFSDRNPSIRGSRRRSSSATAARFRIVCDGRGSAAHHFATLRAALAKFGLMVHWLMGVVSWGVSWGVSWAFSLCSDGEI